MIQKIDGYNIEYKISGAGENTIVMLQGWGTKLTDYDYIADCLNSKYTFIQLDLPGFGQSDEPKEAWDVDSYADFFCKFMQAMNISRATLIGHSYGGRVIIKLASRPSLPFEITNLVLIDSAGVMPKRTFRQKMNMRKYKILKKILNLKLIYSLFPELIDNWRNRQGSADYRNASPIMKQCLVKAVNEDLTDLLPHIKQETLLIWGDKDTATPLSDAKIMESKIPNAGLAVLSGAGHFCFLDQPFLFRKIMHSYFKIGATK